MRSTLRRACGLAIAAFLWVGCTAETEGSAGAAEVELAPDFTLQDLAGNSVTLSDYRGKTVIVDFWATWCAPCVFQIPELNTLWEAHRDREDLVVLGVSIDVEGAEVVGPWIAEKNITYPILLGDQRLAQIYGAPGFPTLFVIRPDGSVNSMHVGLIERDELEGLIAEARESSSPGPDPGQARIDTGFAQRPA